MSLECCTVLPHTDSHSDSHSDSANDDNDRLEEESMCTHKLPVLPVLALAAVSLAGIAAATRSRPTSIEGVWRTAEVRLGGPGARTVSPTEPSLAIITPKHYSRVESHAERPRPAVLDPAAATADELRAAWGPFYAEAG